MNDKPKIFDIIPPDATKKTAFKIPEKSLKSRNEKERPVLHSPVFRAKSSPLKKLSLLALASLVVFALVAQFVLANANVKIVPKNETINLEEKVTINIGKSAIDFSEKQIPGKIIEEESTSAREFTSSGTKVKEEKASGQIKIYNTYSTAPQVLLSSTRFISADGKLFRTTERVTVPGGAYDSKGKLQPGILEVLVVADQPGEDYNIGATTFSIPGFVGTPKYTAFYGKSSESMSGGYRGQVWQVTKDDLEKAKTSLVSDLLKSGGVSLKEKIPSDYTASFKEEALTYEIIESSSLAKEGDEMEKFVYSIKIKIAFFAYKQTDLESVVKGDINSRIEKDQKLYEQSLRLDTSIDSISMISGTERLNIKVSAKIYSDVGEFQLKEALAGKSLLEAQALLVETPQIEKAQVVMWPFWLGKIPQSEDKIKISLLLD